MNEATATTLAIPEVRLGSAGPMVSRLGLGTMTFGVETDASEAYRQLDLFIDHGGTFIDTADVYGSGLSEQILGQWGKKRCGFGDLTLATKGRFGPPPGCHGASRKSLTHCVEASLERLQVDTIDVYFIHGWDRHTEVAETLSALGDLVQAGKIRQVGWSNVAGWQLQKIVSTAIANGYPVPVALQPQYNLLDRGIETEVLPCCLETGIGVTPWSPLGGGWLTGKYRPKTPPAGTTRLGEDPDRGVEAYSLRNTERTHKIIEVLTERAHQLNRPPEHLALAWLASRPGVSSILLGARTATQLEKNLLAADLTLPSEVLEELTAISATGIPPYPYGFLQSWSDMDVWKRLET